MTHGRLAVLVVLGTACSASAPRPITNANATRSLPHGNFAALVTSAYEAVQRGDDKALLAMHAPRELVWTLECPGEPPISNLDPPALQAQGSIERHGREVIDVVEVKARETSERASIPMDDGKCTITAEAPATRVKVKLRVTYPNGSVNDAVGVITFVAYAGRWHLGWEFPYHHSVQDLANAYEQVIQQNAEAVCACSTASCANEYLGYMTKHHDRLAAQWFLEDLPAELRATGERELARAKACHAKVPPDAIEP